MSKLRVRTFVTSLLVAGCAGSQVAPSGSPAASTGAGEAIPSANTPSSSVGTDGAVYFAYVAAESADLIHRVRLGPAGVSVDQTTPVGEMAIENEGPHGLNVSPDGSELYMTTAHGVPDGKLWKFHAGPDTLISAPILLGNFPATLDLTPDGLYALIVNFNLHGEMVPSTVSVVYTPDLVEIEQIPTCTMPHGIRIAPDGLFAYSNCMMDDQLVEIDTRTFTVSRRFSVRKGEEGALEGYEVGDVMTGSMGMSGPTSGGDMSGMEGMSGMAGMDHGAMLAPTCSPTWAQPSPDGKSVYVACNKGDEILIVDRETWTLKKKIQTGRAPYNLGLSADGRLLVASLKGAAQVQFYNADSGEILATVPSSTTITHGVALTPDSRYAFVSVEGKGAEPGKVDVYDLESFEMIGSAEVGQQAGGIIFWRMEPGN